MAKAGEVFGLDADDPFFNEEVGDITPIPNIPVTDAIAAAQAQQEQAQVSKEEAKATEEQKETPAEENTQQAIELSDDTYILYQGEKRPWKEIQGLIQLKKDTDADKYKLNLEKQEFEKAKSFVESNLPFLSALEQSRFGVTLATSLRNGIPEEQAIAAAYAASGLTPQGNPQQVQAPVDPEPAVPADPDFTNPEHAIATIKHLQWESRQNMSGLIEKRVAPLQKRIDAYEEAIRVDAERQKMAQAEERRVTEHNRTMLSQVPNHLKFKPEELTPEQQTAFWGKFDASAASLGIPSAGHKLSPAEIAGITSVAFPGGLNPFVQTQQKPLPIKNGAAFTTTTKAPLGAGSGGGAPLGGNGFSLSDQDRIRNIMEGMAQGKPVEGVPTF